MKLPPWVSQGPVSTPSTTPACLPQQSKPDFLIRPQMRQNAGTRAGDPSSADPAAEPASREARAGPQKEAGPSGAPAGELQQQGPEAAASAAEPVAAAAAVDEDAVKARRRRCAQQRP